MPKGQKKPKIADLEERIAGLTDALQRERADSDNIRRRHDGQISTLKTTVKASVISDLLPAIDNLERALSHTPNDLKGSDYVKGVQSVVKQFENTFKDIGIEKINTVGEEFDPNLHEAVSMEEASLDSEGHTVEVICEELQPGYRLDEEVIRHAMVRVKLEKTANSSKKDTENG